MDTAMIESAMPIAYLVLAILGAIVLIALAVVFFRAAKAVNNVNKTLDNVNELVDKASKELGPVLERIDPLVEKATLTVDTANLELLRVDAILEDVESVTDAADKTVGTIEKITSTPTDLVANAAERLRSLLGSRKEGLHDSKRFVYPTRLGEKSKLAAHDEPVGQAQTHADENDKEACDTPDTSIDKSAAQSVASKDDDSGAASGDDSGAASGDDSDVARAAESGAASAAERGGDTAAESGGDTAAEYDAERGGDFAPINEHSVASDADSEHSVASDAEEPAVYGGKLEQLSQDAAGKSNKTAFHPEELDAKSVAEQFVAKMESAQGAHAVSTEAQNKRESAVDVDDDFGRTAWSADAAKGD